jgi:hypothetical protein
MPLAMTMELEPRNRADLRKLRVGAWIDATINTSIGPWAATDIRPAPQPAAPRPATPLPSHS